MSAPVGLVRTEPSVVGKLEELVLPPTIMFPDASRAIVVTVLNPSPPKTVE